MIAACRLLAGCLALGALSTGCATRTSIMVASRPVIDVRREPRTTATAGRHDPFEETQLLYGERVRLLRVENGWAQIEALEQAEYTHEQRWQGYPGWVPAKWLTPSTTVWHPTIVVTTKWATVWRDAYHVQPTTYRLPMGTMLRATDMGGARWHIEMVDGSNAWIDYAHASPLAPLQTLPVRERRQRILEAAEQFLGDPYLWGGRSPYQQTAQQVTGVDCSGLVNLSHRSIGLAIPRDAHEQFMRARPVTTLKPGDLIFLSAPDNPSRIVHVMLYAGDGQIIEGPGTGRAIHRMALAARLGRSADTLAPGTVIEDQTVFFGSYLE